MRRPAQHRNHSAFGWVRPYAGVEALAVFYNSGGDPDPSTPPTGGDPAPVPKPAPPVVPTVTLSQDDLTALAAKEKSQGERAGARKALTDLATELGFTSIDDAKTFVTTTRQAQQDALTEDEKRKAELDRRESELLAREQAAIAAKRSADQRALLVGLGATGDDLTDAVALLQAGLAADADEQAVKDAAEALKARRPELFGAKAPSTPPPTLPPAPSGAPAGGPPARTGTAAKDAVRAAARKRAEEMGLRRPDADAA